jgi:SAM-dependent methyltransferase
LKPDLNPPVPHLAAGMPADAGQLILRRRVSLVESILPAPGGHLLDFGCGNGAQTRLLAPKFDQVTGVDINEEFLAGFRAALQHSPGADGVQALATGGRAVDLPEASVDVATSFTVLEHVPDEMFVLQDLHRLLKPGGRLILTVPNRWWVFETHGADLPLLPWNRVPFVSWWPKKLHDRWARARIYDRGDIIRLVEAAGFQVDEVFHLTAPMDMISWQALRTLARKTVFRGDRTPFPFLATEIFVAATR